MGFVAVGVMARQLWGRWAGVAAMTVLLGLPEMPVRAHVVMADLPPMAFALVALDAAILFQFRGRRGWLVLSGAALVGALLIHPLLIYTTLPLTMILFLPDLLLPTDRPTQRVTWLDLLYFVAPVLIVGLLTLAAVDRRSFFTWVLQSNYEATSSVPLRHNWSMMTSYLESNWALLGLSVASAVTVAIAPKKRGAVAIIAAWWLATFAILMACSPLWSQYLVFLAYPLAILTGGGVVATGRWMGRLRRGGQVWPCVVCTVLMVLLVISFGVDRWQKTRPDLLDGPEWSSDLVGARAFVETAVPRDGFVATDDPLLAFAAGRLVPPPFTEATKKQIELGNFTAKDATEGMLRYGVQAALFSTGRLIRLPELEEWIDQVAIERREFGELRAYWLDLPRRDPISNMSRFDNGIELRGYALSRGELHPGEVLTVMLFWRGAGRVPKSPHVFAHLVDEDGGLWGQHDRRLKKGERQPGQSEDDELVFDVHSVKLSPEAPSGTYFLTVGMYPWPSLERVPAFLPDGTRWPQDRVVVARLKVVSR
jgi:hypothetical protein